MSLALVSLIRAEPRAKLPPNSDDKYVVITDLDSLYVGGGVCVGFLILTPVLLIANLIKEPKFKLVSMVCFPVSCRVFKIY